MLNCYGGYCPVNINSSVQLADVLTDHSLSNRVTIPTHTSVECWTLSSRMMTYQRRLSTSSTLVCQPITCCNGQCTAISLPLGVRPSVRLLDCDAFHTVVTAL